MSFDVDGTLHKKFDTESKTETFQARDFILEITSGQYPQLIKFQLTQDRCALLDPFEEGDQLKVHFDLRGREWNGKYFTNLNAWRLEKAQQDQPAPPPASGGDASFPSAGDEPQVDSSQDDLPF